MAIPPVGPPPAPPPAGPVIPTISSSPSSGVADFFSPLRNVGSTISASEVLLSGRTMSLMQFVAIIGENSQGLKQEENLTDLLDSFLQKLLKGNGVLTADLLNALLAQVTDNATQSALLSFTQNSQVTLMNAAIDNYNAGLPAEIAAVVALNQAIDDYNNPISPNYGLEAPLTAAITAYNAFVTTRAADIVAYNNAVDSYNLQVTINNAAIDLLNDQRTANGLPLLPHQASLPHRDAMEAPPSGPAYDSPGDVTPLASRDPAPFGSHLLIHLDTVTVQITSTIIAQLYDPIANPAFARLDSLNLLLRYSDEYLALKNRVLNPTLVESPDQIHQTESTPSSSAQGASGGGGLMTLGNSLSNANLERVISSQLFSAGTIGVRLASDTLDKVELLTKFLLTGTALQAATGPAFAALGNNLGQSTLSPTAIDIVLAQAVAQRVGALVSSGVVNSNIAQLLAGDPGFQKLTPDQQLALINNLTAAVNLSLLGLAFSQLGLALGIPGLAGQLLGNGLAGAGVAPSTGGLAGQPIDLTQIGDALVIALLAKGIAAETATLIAAQFIALIQANPALAGATALNSQVSGALNGALSQSLQANGVGAQAANSLSGTVLSDVLGATALSSPEQAVQQGVSESLIRSLFLPRDTALMISAGVPTSWILPASALAGAVATGTASVLGSAVNSGQALASAGASVGVALRTPGALASEAALKQAIAAGLVTSLGISASQAAAITASLDLKALIDRNALRSSLKQAFEQNGADAERAAVMADVATSNILTEANNQALVLNDQLRTDILRGDVVATRAAEELVARSQIADDSIAAAEADSRRMAIVRAAFVAPIPVAEATGQATAAVLAASTAAAALPPTSPLLDATKNDLLKAEELVSQLATLIANQLSAAVGSNKALLIAQAFIASLYGRERRDKDERDNPVSLLNLTKDQIQTLILRDDANLYRGFIEERVNDFIKENTMMDYGAYLKARLLNLNGRTFLDTVHEAMSTQGGGVDSGFAKKSTDMLV